MVEVVDDEREPLEEGEIVEEPIPAWDLTVTFSQKVQILAESVFEPKEGVTVADIMAVFGQDPKDILPSFNEKEEVNDKQTEKLPPVTGEEESDSALSAVGPTPAPELTSTIGEDSIHPEDVV